MTHCNKVKGYACGQQIWSCSIVKLAGVQAVADDIAQMNIDRLD
jgi:hypothetical protein